MKRLQVVLLGSILASLVLIIFIIVAQSFDLLGDRAIGILTISALSLAAIAFRVMITFCLAKLAREETIAIRQPGE